MLKIDAHQHFWHYDPVRDSWITNDMKKIRRDFLPEDLAPVLSENGMDGCMVVQSDQSPAETMFQMGNALENDFIKGVVGWVDLRAKDIDEQLAFLSNFKKLKGFRHILQGEADRSLMLKKKFMNGIAHLDKYHFTYDILIFPDQIKAAAKLAAAFPYQKFILDHIAKPPIHRGEIEAWAKDIRYLAANENVACKVSGMVTEASWKSWKQSDFQPYLDVIVEAFGMKRLLFGSDWPVCLLSATYKQVKGICNKYFKSFSGAEKDDFYGGNAIRWYGLDV
ncbi:MAG: amidohydrolase family protein [Niabella sp.]